MANTDALALLFGLVVGAIFSPVIDGIGDMWYKWVTVPRRRIKEERDREWLVKKNDIEVAGMLAFLNEAVEKDKKQRATELPTTVIELDPTTGKATVMREGVEPVEYVPRQSIDVQTDEEHISTKS